MKNYFDEGQENLIEDCLSLPYVTEHRIPLWLTGHVEMWQITHGVNDLVETKQLLLYLYSGIFRKTLHQDVKIISAFVMDMHILQLSTFYITKLLKILTLIY